MSPTFINININTTYRTVPLQVVLSEFCQHILIISVTTRPHVNQLMNVSAWSICDLKT